MKTHEVIQMERSATFGHAISDGRGKATMSEWVLPGHTNALGTVFGGVVVSWIDIVGVTATQRWARKPVVTLSIDHLQFFKPIQIGYTVLLLAEVVYTGKTSMEVEVTVNAENTVSGEVMRAARAYLCYVALDSEGNPTAVPTFVPKTDSELSRWEQAEARRVRRRETR